MKFFLQKDPSREVYYPAGARNYDKSKKVPYGDLIEVDYIKKRNIGLHRKFFALINMAFDNLPEKFNYKTEEELRYNLTIAAGFYEYNTFLDGTISKKAMSIAFDKLDDTEFEKLYQAVIDVILKEFEWELEFITANLINFI